MNKALLPKVAKPVRYQVKLDVDLDSFNYKGSQTVDLEIVEETSSFEVNAIDIEITNAYLTSNITNDLKGFYKSQFLDLNNNEKWLATTQFEPTSARNAFPCWDEPEYKAVFSMTLISDKKYLRISNEKVLEEKELEDGKVQTTYVDSMIMSTYLVAFVIGELEITEIGNVGNTQIRIIHRPGFSHQTGFAGKAGLKILEFFENYYKIPYPGSKLRTCTHVVWRFSNYEVVGWYLVERSFCQSDGGYCCKWYLP